jgi:hypothetical protein
MSDELDLLNTDDWEKVNDEENTCGVFSMEIPQDLFVLMEYDELDEPHVISVFCNRDYAKLYGEWLSKKHPRSSFEIEKTRGNPGRETINDYV